MENKLHIIFDVREKKPRCYIYIRIVEYAKVDGEKSSDKNLNFCISLQVRIFIPLFFLSLFDKGKKGKEKKKKI